jgi:hypothetical protein
MTKKEVKELHPGDEVFWNDPDEGTCSKNIIILEISTKGDIVCITGDDGADLECFAHELN